MGVCVAARGHILQLHVPAEWCEGQTTYPHVPAKEREWLGV
jgi:hypothetical protein